MLKRFVRPRGRGGGNSYTLPIGVCAARRGHDFGAPDLERAIQFYDGASPARRAREQSPIPIKIGEAFKKKKMHGNYETPVFLFSRSTWPAV